MNPDRRAAVLAAKLLLRLRAVHLPLDPLQMVRSIPRVSALSYTEYAVHTGDAPTVHTAVSDYGYVAHHPDGRSRILYNAARSPESIRFTLAHELGHLMLRHASDEAGCDAQADVFARCLLCPAPYADELGLRDADAYRVLFAVPPPVAEQAARCRGADRALLDGRLYDALRTQFRAALGRPTPGSAPLNTERRTPT